MRFDDRLLTVLNQPGGDRHDAAVRWRQLVDLVARAGANASSPAVARALESIRAESNEVDERLRAAAARAVAALPLPIGLLEYFAADRLAVSAPVLAAATLEPREWQALIAVADEETRQFLEALHPELRGGAPAQRSEPQPQAAVEEAETEGSFAPPSLEDVVARIERRRRVPEVPAEEQVEPDLPADQPEDSPALFRWECDPSGEIAWVEGAPRGALIGRSIARLHDGPGDRVDEDVVRAFAIRAPFRDAGLTVAPGGVASGNWKISGVPAFEPANGRFAGYRGIAMRQTPSAPPRGASEALSDPASVRELVHEIKTPLNAIIGFAEIIEGQYLGPAHRRYRERANDIVAQARVLLAAIEDLDLAARTRSAPEGEKQVELGPLVERLAEPLNTLAASRGATLEVGTMNNLYAAIDPQLAERVLQRFATAMVARADPGERLRLWLDQAGDQCVVGMTRPPSFSASHARLSGSAEGEAGDEGLVLRLARGLAHLAGAEIVVTDVAVKLLLPRA